ncbi:uncharacterized protein LOC128961831 [Oppia nitens]|uniref:uncharacterized protein LOC128961831 n=1 Tax=Oppia nitens TaxID=1686743 RepID=UPI0023DB822F|nr:uncharacterized protein LOC128961831 [Oppia nitens]
MCCLCCCFGSKDKNRLTHKTTHKRSTKVIKKNKNRVLTVKSSDEQFNRPKTPTKMSKELVSFYHTMNSSNDKKTTDIKTDDTKSTNNLWIMSPTEIPEDDLYKTYRLPYGNCSAPRDLLKHLGYELFEQLGQGGFGTVYKAIYTHKNGNKQEMACKEIIIKEEKRKKMLISLRSEIYSMKIAKQHNHPFLIKLDKCFIIEYNKTTLAYILMEFADSKTLYNDLTKLTDEDIQRYFAQIAQGLAFLHRKGIAHKDLKPENILLMYNQKNCEKEVRISDYGLALKAYKTKKGKIEGAHFAGTRAYMAPEIIRLEVYREFRKEEALKDNNPFKCDVWALGVCLYEMFTRKTPFDTSNLEAMLYNMEHKKYNLPKNIDTEANDLLVKLLEPNSNERIDMFGVLSHPWINEIIDWTLVEQRQ